jgi:DNA-binding GntR family transcriptional regulator
MINHPTMTESAALELRKAILRGHYPPGMRLVPAKLEADLKLSRTAIREAIRELVGTGLAESATYKGACVASPLVMEEIREIYEVRYQVEGRAAYLAARQMPAAKLKEMEMLLQEMAKPMEGGGYFRYLLNQQFHDTLYRASGWKYLVKVIDRVFDQVLLFRSSLYRNFTDGELDRVLSWEVFKEYHEDHIHILDCLKAADSAATRRAVVQNLQRGFDGLEKLSLYVRNNYGSKDEDETAGLGKGAALC